MSARTRLAFLLFVTLTLGACSDMGLNPSRRAYPPNRNGRILEDIFINGIAAGEQPIWSSEAGTKDVDPGFWGANLDIYCATGVQAQQVAALSGGILRAYAVSGGNRALIAQGRVLAAQGTQTAGNNTSTIGQWVLRASAAAADSWQVTFTPPRSIGNNGSSSAQYQSLLTTALAHISFAMYGDAPAPSIPPILAYSPQTSPAHQLTTNAPLMISTIQALFYKLLGFNPTQTGFVVLINAGETAPVAGAQIALPAIPVAPLSTFSLNLDDPLMFPQGLWVGFSTSSLTYQPAGALPPVADRLSVTVGYQ